MTARHSPGVLIILLFLPAAWGQDLGPLRAKLADGLKALSETEGYGFSGRFVYKRGGRETLYRAARSRRGGSVLAEFTANDQTWNMKFGALGQDAWAASPEAVARLERRELPALVLYDYPVLAAELRRVLSRGPADPDFRAGVDGNEVYVRGKLSDGSGATFLIESRHLQIRKVSVRGKASLPVWYFVILERGSPEIMEPGGTFGDAIEVWFSEFGDTGELFLPRRADYVDGRGVVGTLFDDGPQGAAYTDAGARTPPAPGWTRQVFTPGTNLRQPSLFNTTPGSGVSHDERAPASAARRLNAIIAIWTVAAPWLAILFPAAPGPRVFAVGMAVGLSGAGALLAIRRRRFGSRILRPAVYILAVFALVGTAGLAAIHLNSARIHSLLALHGAIRYAATGNAFYAPSASGYFRRFPVGVRPSVELARAVLRYASAYDLSCTVSNRPSQLSTEAGLFAYARPISGILKGYRAHSWDAATFASSLGVTGLAIGRDGWVAEGRTALKRVFREQFAGGMHVGGPGPGVRALNDSVTFLHSLRRAGQPDAELERSWLSAVETTLHLVSPAGTLPLFGQTSLDQSADAAMLFTKASVLLPDEVGGQASAAARAFWTRGCHWSPGLGAWFRSTLLRVECLTGDPLAMLLVDRDVSVTALPGSSFVAEGGSVAVLRSGFDPDSLYLAVNAIPPVPEQRVRDLLSVEFCGRGGLLLTGAGYPASNSRDQAAAARTSSHNVVSIRGRNQSDDGRAAITAALVNQPRFDFVRTVGDSVYEDGNLRRDAVLVRPAQGHPGYAVLIDRIRTADDDSEVEWFLHGRGDLALGFAQNHLWTVRAFADTVWRRPVVLLTTELFGAQGTPRSNPGRLFFRDAAFDAATESLVVAWKGSRQIGAVLWPRGRNEPAPTLERSQSGETVRVGATDRISIGSPDTALTSGPLSHLSDTVVVRDRGKQFPAVLLLNGTDFRYNEHAITASAPVYASLEGFRGALLSSQPGVRLEFVSPALREGAAFQLDGRTVEAAQGRLVLELESAGSHTLK